MKTITATCVAGAIIGAMGLLPHSATANGEGRQRPNILFINADDLGWTDAGFMGSTFYETPNLDRLAAEGMVFTDAYAPATNCAPSRATVYTGHYSPRHGVLTVGDPERGRPVFRRLIPPDNNVYLGEDEVMFVSYLRDHGYATCHVGKWHVSHDPLDYGFQTNIGGFQSGHPVGGYFSPYENPNLEDGPEGEHLTFRLTDEAIDWLKNHDREIPFFLSMQFYVPHTPIQAKEETIEKYRNRAPTAGHFHPVYAAMVDHMDVNIGRLLDALEELEVADNTLILFTSDNGGIYRFSRNWPLRGEKGTYYEGGIRVPMVVRWPGHVEPGSRSSTPVSGVDFFPTLMEAAGIEVPEDQILDGVSLISLFKGEADLEERPLFWHFPFYLQAYPPGNVESRDPLFRTRPGSVVRLGKWKLHEYFEDGALELYNLEADLGERFNLAGHLPEKTAELHGILTEWREEIGAQMPTGTNPRFDAEREAEAIRAFYSR